MCEGKCSYEPNSFVIKASDDMQPLLDWMIKVELAREIHPQMMDGKGIENEREVDTNG